VVNPFKSGTMSAVSARWLRAVTANLAIFWQADCFSVWYAECARLVITILALGIGVSISVFSLVDGVALRRFLIMTLTPDGAGKPSRRNRPLSRMVP